MNTFRETTLHWRLTTEFDVAYKRLQRSKNSWPKNKYAKLLQ